MQLDFTSTLSPATHANPKLLERFWAKVNKTDTCWLWTAYTNGSGYGILKVGTAMLAHRISYAIHIGPIPAGFCVCHRCDTPACVNPDHLFLGTPKDNALDKVAKGRQCRTRERAMSTCKVTNEEVRTIRALYATGNYTYKDLSKQYNVSIQLIYKFCTRRLRGYLIP